MMAFFARWLRHFFPIDESRLRARVYLHAGLDIDRATEFWSRAVGIPRAQFRRPYRALADASIRTTKHPMGCAYLSYCCTTTHRAIIGLVAALLSSSVDSGVAQSAERRPVKAMVESSSLSPGAMR